MHWSFWFAAQWRGISVFLITLMLFIGGVLASMWNEGEMHIQQQGAQSALQQALHQQKIAQQQYALWQEKKVQLQSGAAYINSSKTPALAGVLQTWQEEHVQRQVRYTVETMEAPSPWHDKAAQHIHGLQLRFWVQDENDLLRAWTEKKTLPCLLIVQSAQLSRGEAGGIWVEEEAVCVQF